MELFGWVIERDAEGAPLRPLLVGTAIVLPLSYVIGYGLIDLLALVTLTPSQIQGGFPHVARTLAGMLALVAPLMALIRRFG